MTRTPHNTIRLTARLGWLAASIALAGLLAVPTGDVDAGRRTSSAAIADTAGRALEALDQWGRSRSPADYVRFLQTRDAAATITATELALDASDLRGAWSGVPGEKQHAILAAISQLGVPYRSLESDPGVGFDCSGLTIWAFAEAGVEIPRSSRSQIRAAHGVEREHAEPGDLVYYPGHIGIYIGVETYVHSPNSGNDVVAGALPSKSLRFGDAVVGARSAVGLLVDGAAAISQ